MKNDKRRKGLFVAIPLTLLAAALGGCTLRKSDKTDRFHNDPYIVDSFVERSEKLPSVRRSTSAELTATTTAYDGFEMQSGASVRLDEVTGIRYKAYVPEALREKAEEGEATLGFVIAPTDYFEAAKAYRVGNSPDYVKELKLLSANDAAVSVPLLYSIPVQEDGAWIVQGSIGTILYKNLNRSFSAVAFSLENGTYTYADYDSSNERSASYVASAALNDPNGNYDDEQKDLLWKIVGGGIDQAAGLSETESEAVESRAIALSWRSVADKISVGDGQTFSLKTVVNYGSGDLSVSTPVYWRSSDESVLSVNEKGEAVARKEGKATVYASVGEQTLTKEVTVQKALRCSIRDDSGHGLLSFSTTNASVSVGKEFQTTITLTDEAYGDLTVWIGGKAYETSGGALEFSATVTEDTQFVVESVATAFKYFSTKTSSALKLNAAKSPSKVILPKYAENGNVCTTIFEKTLGVNTQKNTNMQELIVPDSYTLVHGSAFRYCAALKTIKLYNTNLSSLTTTASWNTTNKPTTIYVPSTALSAYQNSSFWSSSGANIVGF